MKGNYSGYSTTKTLVMNALMVALVFLATYFTKVTTPVGPFNLGDTVIFITAIFLGRKSGFIAGAIGSALADIAMSYALFAPVTFIVKGFEGYLAGLIVYKLYRSGEKRINKEIIKLIAIIAGSIVMISGYFFSELYVLSIFDKSMGLAKALMDLPFNIVQGVACSTIAFVLAAILDRYKIDKYILN